MGRALEAEPAGARSTEAETYGHGGSNVDVTGQGMETGTGTGTGRGYALEWLLCGGGRIGLKACVVMI